MRYEDKIQSGDHSSQAAADLLIPESGLKRVVIIGAGFGGIELANRLSKKCQVLLIDKNDYHTFHPLLFQLATTGIEDKSITFSIGKMFSENKNVTFIKAEATGIKKEESLLTTTAGVIKYDQLVVATGSTINYQENPGLVKNAIGLKNINDALKLKQLLMQNFEKYVAETESFGPRNFNIVIVGGGTAGVEIAGAIAELKNTILPYYYPGFVFSGLQIHIVEASGKLLKGMSKAASKKANQFLKQLDVKVWLNTSVESYRDGKVVMDDLKTIASDTFIWAAGVKGQSINGFEEHELTKNNRIKVDAFNRVPGSKNIFVIGDSAEMMNTDLIEPHPMIAPVAIQQAKNLARNINTGDVSKWKKFNYIHWGTMTTIGRGRAIVDFKYLRFQGTIAWYIWMFVHLSLISGFKNRLSVLGYWLRNFFSYNKITRLIMRPYKKVSHLEAALRIPLFPFFMLLSLFRK